eukprot:12732964-Ditylum_brightwellii.AAC.1
MDDYRRHMGSRFLLVRSGSSWDGAPLLRCRQRPSSSGTTGVPARKCRRAGPCDPHVPLYRYYLERTEHQASCPLARPVWKVEPSCETIHAVGNA